MDIVRICPLVSAKRGHAQSLISGLPGVTGQIINVQSFDGKALSEIVRTRLSYPAMESVQIVSFKRALRGHDPYTNSRG